MARFAPADEHRFGRKQPVRIVASTRNVDDSNLLHCPIARQAPQPKPFRSATAVHPQQHLEKSCARSPRTTVLNRSRCSRRLAGEQALRSAGTGLSSLPIMPRVFAESASRRKFKSTRHRNTRLKSFCCCKAFSIGSDAERPSALYPNRSKNPDPISAPLIYQAQPASPARQRNLPSWVTLSLISSCFVCNSVNSIFS